MIANRLALHNTQRARFARSGNRSASAVNDPLTSGADIEIVRGAERRPRSVVNRTPQGACMQENLMQLNLRLDAHTIGSTLLLGLALGSWR